MLTGQAGEAGQPQLMAFSFLIPLELKARHERRGVTRVARVELFLKPTWIGRGERLVTSVLALQNLVCCRSELSFNTGLRNVSTLFLLRINADLVRIANFMRRRRRRIY